LPQPSAKIVSPQNSALVAEGVSDVAAGMAGDEEHLGLGLAEAVAVAVLDGDVDARDARPIAGEADDGAAGRLLDLAVATDVIPMMMGVEDVGDLPASLVGLGQHRARHGRVDHADGTTLRLAH